MSSSNSSMRNSREALLRPLEVISGIVNRRNVPHDVARLLPFEVQGTRRKEAARRPKASQSQAGLTTGTTGEQAGAAAESGGDGNGGDGGDGDGDGPRRRTCSSASPSSPPSRATRRKPIPRQLNNCSHVHALVVLVVLAILVFAMAFLLVERGHPWLAGEVMVALGGLPRLARALVRPK